MFIITMPQIDISRTPLELPKPTLKNCGGYRLPIIETVSGKHNLVTAYSSIDLSVCGLTALYNGERSVTDLSKWFINNEYKIAELWINISIGDNDRVLTHNISEWKHHIISNSSLNKLFKNNAPFTFR